VVETAVEGATDTVPGRGLLRALARGAGETLVEFVAELVDGIYPRLCALCGASAPDGVACAAHELPRTLLGTRCRRCAVRIADALGEGALCAACRRGPPRFERVLALGDYHEGSLRDWLLALKHGARPDLGAVLGRRLGARLGELGPGVLGVGALPVLVPVPAHPLRRAERGYDPALLLARGAAAALEAECLRALRRLRWTPPQGEPGARSRAANVRGAFGLVPGAALRLAGRAVWIVDDVVTSGASASACARELARAGAASPGAASPGAGSPGAASPGAGSPGAASPGAGSPGAASPASIASPASPASIGVVCVARVEPPRPRAGPAQGEEEAGADGGRDGEANRNRAGRA